MSKTSRLANTYYGFKPWEIIIISILIILIIAAPWIFTLETFLGFDFESTGQIGDTIGGITGPFVNLLAAFLVYKSFSAQIKANKLQQDNHKEQIDLIIGEQSIAYLLKLYDKVQEDYLSNESNIENGWAKNLENGINSIRDRERELDENGLISDDMEKEATVIITDSIAKVQYIYHIILMLAVVSKNVVNKTKDPNVINVVRYVTLKTDTLFKNNSYNVLLNQNFDSLFEKNFINKELHHELTIGVKASNAIRKDIDALLDLTVEMPLRM